MRRLLLGAVAVTVVAALAVPAQAGPSRQAKSTSQGATSSSSSSTTEYVVLYASGASVDAAHAAIKAAGGTIVKENATVGLATVRTTNANFLDAVTGQSAVFGAMPNRPVGQAPRSGNKPDTVENDRSVSQAAAAAAAAAASS